jgi:hypothetical protein
VAFRSHHALAKHDTNDSAINFQNNRCEKLLKRRVSKIICMLSGFFGVYAKKMASVTMPISGIF